MSSPDSIDLEDLSGDVVAIDGNIDMYQYITAITDDWNDYVRNDDGQPISQLIGLVSRYGQVLDAGIRPIYIFDGGYPDLKEETLDNRRSPDAEEKFWEAKENGNKQLARKLAYQKTGLSDFMIESAGEVLDAMGIPWFMAPSEGEPQAAELVRQDIADHVMSEDWDTILYDIPTLIRDFGTSGGEMAYRDRILADQQWTIEQLRWYSVLRGSDYNSSVSGVGPVRGKQIVSDATEFGDVIEAAESYGDVDSERWWRALELFQSPEVDPDPDVTWTPFDIEEVREVACYKYGLETWQVESRLKNVEPPV
jgi:flap endonuclease-1